MQVPAARTPIIPYQLHDPKCNGNNQTKFTLIVIRNGRRNFQIGCCTCTKKQMSDIIDLVNDYCFSKSDRRQRVLFYETLEGQDWVAPYDLVENRVHPNYRVLSVRVSCVSDDEYFSDEDRKILVATTPPPPPRGLSPSSSDGGVSETSPEGSDVDDRM